MQLEIKAALVCDHVRREDTGKYILIGVYTAEIVMSNKPGRFVPTFWIEITPPVQDAKLELEIKVESPGAKPRIISAAAHIERQKSAVLSLRTPLLEINEPGFLKLSIRPKGGRWRKILALEILFADSELQAS